MASELMSLLTEFTVSQMRLIGSLVEEEDKCLCTRKGCASLNGRVGACKLTCYFLRLKSRSSL